MSLHSFRTPTPFVWARRYICTSLGQAVVETFVASDDGINLV